MLLARLLSSEEMGGYFLATSLVALAVALVQLGLGRALVKLIAGALANNSPSAARQAVHVGIVTVGVISSLAAVGLTLEPGHLLIGLLDSGDLLYKSLRWIALLTLTMALVELFAEMLRGFHDIRSASLLVDQLLQRLILVACLFVIWLSGIELNLDQVLLLSFVSALFAVLVAAKFIRTNLSKIGYGGSRTEIGKILRLGPPFLVIRLNFWLLNVASVWVLGMFRPMEEVAIYGAANLLASLVLAPQTITNGVSAPIIVELFQKQRTDLLENIIRAAAFFALIPASLLAIVLIIYGDHVLRLIYGGAYAQGFLVLAVLAVGRCVAVACGAPSITLAMTQYQNTVMRVMTVTSVVTLTAYFLLAPRAGSLGVAMVTALSVALQNIGLVYIVRKKLNILTLPGFSPDAWKRFALKIKKKD
jgi:O-antigen/teichoic acid export membrane protein